MAVDPFAAPLPQHQPPRIPGYRITGTLGKGGMGRVYEAEQIKLGRPVAIKAFSYDGTDEDARFFLDRFFTEARVLARMKEHENIVQIHDLVEGEGGDHYIVMQRIEGLPLEALAPAKERMDPARALDIVIQTARALEHAHGHGIIHRDVKPGNIMIEPGGRVKVMDFGLARSGLAHNKTQAGFALGTPDYMSPEQVVARGEIDGRSDVYSLGTVLYRLLTGQAPFHDENLFALAEKIRFSPPVAPSLLNPSLAPELERLILKALEKKPQDRFASAAEFADALDALRGEGAASAAVTPLDKRPPAEAKGLTHVLDASQLPTPKKPSAEVESAAPGEAGGDGGGGDGGEESGNGGDLKEKAFALLELIGGGNRERGAQIALGVLALAAFCLGALVVARLPKSGGPALPGGAGGSGALARGDALAHAEKLFESSQLKLARREAVSLNAADPRSRALKNTIEAVLDANAALDRRDVEGARRMLEGAAATYWDSGPMADARRRLEREASFAAGQAYEQAESAWQSGRHRAARESYVRAENLKPGFEGSQGPAAALAAAASWAEDAADAVRDAENALREDDFGFSLERLAAARDKFGRVSRDPGVEKALKRASDLRSTLEDHFLLASLMARYRDGDAAEAQAMAGLLSGSFAARRDVASRVKRVEEVGRLLGEAERERSIELANRVLRLEKDEANDFHIRAQALKDLLEAESREAADKLKEEADRLAASGNLEEALRLYQQGRLADPANPALAEAHERAAVLLMDEAHRLGYTTSQAAEKRRLYNVVIENSHPSDSVREQAMNQIERLGLGKKWD